MFIKTRKSFNWGRFLTSLCVFMFVSLSCNRGWLCYCVIQTDSLHFWRLNIYTSEMWGLILIFLLFACWITLKASSPWKCSWNRYSIGKHLFQQNFIFPKYLLGFNCCIFLLFCLCDYLKFLKRFKRSTWLNITTMQWELITFLLQSLNKIRLFKFMNGDFREASNWLFPDSCLHVYLTHKIY